VQRPGASEAVAEEWREERAVLAPIILVLVDREA